MSEQRNTYGSLPNEYNDLYKPKEMDVPSIRETFEAQVLVVTAPRKEMRSLLTDGIGYYPFHEAHRVIASGKFRAELVPSSVANGKPTLIITETGEEAI